MWGEGEERGGRWFKRREVGKLCVCGRMGGGWGERREVLHMILFWGGGGGWRVQNFFEKWGYLHGAWRSKLRVY